MSLYRTYKSTRRYLTDPKHRKRIRELERDIRETERDVGSWGRLGMDRADPDKRFGIIGMTNLPFHAKFQALVGKGMQLRGWTPVVFTGQGLTYGHRYYRMLGIENLIPWDKTVRDEAIEPAAVVEIISGLLPSSPTVTDVTGIRYHSVQVGKHALSAVCRQLIQGRLDLSDPEVAALLKKKLEEAVTAVIVAERIFDRTPMRKLFVRDAGYIPNGAIYETAMNRGVDCIVYEEGQRKHGWIVKRYNPTNFGQHYFSLSESSWTRVKGEGWSDADDRTLENEFAGRYKPDSTDDTRRLQSGKRVKSPDEVIQELGLDPKKKNGVIFSHIAWDAAFFFGSCLFEGFEDWLFQTVKFVAANCPEMNWIIKLHPFNAFKLQREGKSEESEMTLLRSLQPLPENVKLLRSTTDISTQSLFPLVDYILTVNGTVGMEFPCWGVPAVLAGTGRYDGLGFTLEPKSQTEYFDLLKRLHTVPRLDEGQVNLARRHYLAVMQRRQISLEDALPMELKRANEAESDVHNNVRFTARSLAQFEGNESVRLLCDWLDDSREPDLLDNRLWQSSRGTGG